MSTITLAAGLAELGIALSDEAQHKLLAFRDLLLKWNKTYNLTALRDPAQAISHHLLDSLAILPHVGDGPLLDVGSGGGLPAIPLAIARPELAVDMVDTVQKKATFLQQAIIELGLKNALQANRAQYDFVLIDCPPALNMLTVNALVAADSVLIPMQCEYYALEGLSDLVETLRKIRAHLNSRLEIEGLLRTMYNSQSTLTQQVSSELESHFGSKVYQTIVPRNVRLAEAPSYGKPVIAFDKSSKGALAYSALAREILERVAP